MLSASAISTLERLAAKYDRFYERLLATLDIRVQEYISSCADSSKVDEIESSLLSFDGLRQNLRLQNVSALVGPVFPDAKPNQGTKRGREDPTGAAPVTKRKVAPNHKPHPSLALTSYSEWDKVRRFTDLLPRVDGISVCGLFHCRQVCNSGCEKVHGKLTESTISETEKWIADSKAKTAKLT
jgi:hypothetical protein